MGTPTSWHAALPHGGTIAGLTEWWKRFDDPTLTRLVEAAEQNSPTIALAVGRVREARAAVTSSRASLLPSLSGSGSITRGKNLSGGTGAAGGETLSTVKSASADAGWELDLFGGNRRSLQGSKARLSSAEADWHDARVTLAAEVANAYTTAREYQNLIALYNQEFASRQATEQLTALKIREGLAPRADALSVEASTASSASTLENQRGLYAQTLNQLVMLTGLTFAQIESALGAPAAIPRIANTVELALPASTVSQRPDVRSTERQLAAASADVGVAIADALPSLSLAGSIGINTSRAGGQSTTLRTWSFGPSLNVPLFQGGANAAKIESARARYDQALAAYRSSVLTAVQEIEDALVRIDTVSRRRAYAEKAAGNYSSYFAAIEKSYREGKSSLLQQEDARRQSLSTQESLLAVHLEQAQSWVALYKAVGGGWETSPAVTPTMTSR
jgi:NodT family efflux transporter outer membrane factor (OMF) lipoprotein